MVAPDTLLVTTALPVLRVDLGASLVDLEWTVNAHNVSFACFLLTRAALVDRLGRTPAVHGRRMSVFTAASAVAALRRQAIEEELERTGPPFDPELDEAEALLANFADFWETEPSPAERRRVLASLFDPVWQDGGVIVARQAAHTLPPLLPNRRRARAAASEKAGCQRRERRDSNPRPPA